MSSQNSLMVIAWMVLQAQSSELVETQVGDCPIVISAPHGGTLPIPGSSPRTGQGKEKFVTVRDTGVDRLARLTASAVEKKSGRKPWLVVANFSRKYCDANRPEDQGTEDAAALAIHRRYHAFLRQAVEAVRTKPQAILVDIHAQGTDSLVVFRGTQNLKTWTDRATLDTFCSQLAKSGWQVFPVAQTTEKEQPSYTGGTIVALYGRREKTGVDALQFEFGSSYLRKDKADQTADQLADALCARLNQGPGGTSG